MSAPEFPLPGEFMKRWESGGPRRHVGIRGDAANCPLAYTDDAMCVGSVGWRRRRERGVLPGWAKMFVHLVDGSGLKPPGVQARTAIRLLRQACAETETVLQ